MVSSFRQTELSDTVSSPFWTNQTTNQTLITEEKEKVEPGPTNPNNVGDAIYKNFDEEAKMA